LGALNKRGADNITGALKLARNYWFGVNAAMLTSDALVPFKFG